MDANKCKKIIAFFDQFRSRPVMYTGKSYGYAWTIQLIRGFDLALTVTDEETPAPADIKNAYIKRGWSEVYFGAVEEMKSRGLEGDEITKELISVEIDSWTTFSERFD